VRWLLIGGVAVLVVGGGATATILWLNKRKNNREERATKRSKPEAPFADFYEPVELKRAPRARSPQPTGAA
jgi:hypothetical protein